MKVTSKHWIKVLFSVALLVVAAGGGTSLWGQAIYGSIYGQIVDNTGAAIPNATITVTDAVKGTTSQVTSSANGEYTVSHLIPDVYDISVTATGFRKLSNKGIHVSADTSPKVDLKLEIGSINETVEVTTEVPELKTDRADVATIFNQRTVSDLPITGRNFTSLELLIPGSQQMGWSQNAAENPQGSAQVQINGQHFSGVAYELDGAANQDPILGQIVINPALDAVTEAKITTQNYDAEFGQAVAAVVTAQTKSGTNSFHGSAFDFRRSDAQQARNPFSQSTPNSVTGRLLPSALYSQFGGSVGGPIIKQKAFFFGDYQGVRQKTGGSSRVTVPSTLMHNSCLSGTGCDLSEYLSTSVGRGPVQGQIYNPRVLDPVTKAPAPFANNLIPQQYLSPQSLALLKLIPTPNGPGIANNYSGSGSGVINNNQFDVRIDDQVSARTHAFARYSYFDNSTLGGVIFGSAGGAGFTGFGGSSKSRDQSAVAGADIALKPTLLTDFRLGYLRYHVQTSKFGGTSPLATQAGIPGLNLDSGFTSGSPAFYSADTSNTNGDGLANFGSGLNVNGCNCSLLETEDQYQIVNNWTKTLGNHSIKFGADLRYGRNLRVPSDSNRAGELTFGAVDTENLVTKGLDSPGGLGFASFLLGDVTNFTRYVSSSTNAKESQKRVFTYAEDSWRVTPNLTFNYGLRWEIYFPETVNGKGNGGYADLNTGTIRVAGYGPYNTAMNVHKDYKTLAPRIGIAYQPHPSTVIRAGYGRSFDIGVFGSIFGHVLTQNLPVLANQNLTSSGANSSAFNLAQGPTAFAFPSVPSTGLLSIPNGLSAKFRSDPNVFPTIDAWNLSLQQQLSNTTSITIAYVGNKGTHTFAGDGQTTNPNEAATCLSASQSSTGQPLCFNPNPTNANQTSNTKLLRPYFSKFGWTQNLTSYHNAFDTHYNALQVTAEKRFSQGLQFTANYAWQRAFNYNNDYADINKKVGYGRYDDLREQQFTLFGNYQLPFGKNRMFGSGMRGWENAIVGGFELSSSINWSGGLPFTPSYGECGKDILGSPCMPNKTGPNLPLSLKSFNPVGHSQTYFIPGPAFGPNGSTSGVFQRPSVDQFGTVGRNNYFGPSFFNADLSLLKNIPIRESIEGQLRVNAFNAFNHINPGNPGTCIDCSIGSNAGVITGMAVGASPRQLEFSARITF
ncbi:MAG: TonB-dependent receptor [Edaphobacter sp.]